MALFTTYLGYLNKTNLAELPLVNPEVIYVMRNRGNNIVAPGTLLLKDWKNRRIDWDQYRSRYLEQVGHSAAVLWMKNIGNRARHHDVILVCYEKDATHCHRTLLAQLVAKWSGCKYEGELKGVE